MQPSIGSEDYMFVILASIPKWKSGKCIRGSIIMRFDTTSDGENGFLCADMVGGYADVLEYLLTWMGDEKYAEMDIETFEKYYELFNKVGRPRDEDLAETLAELDKFAPIGEEKFEERARSQVSDEFMEEVRKFIAYAKQIKEDGDIPIIVRYNGDNGEEFDDED